MANQFVTILFTAIVFSSMIVIKPVEQAKGPKSTEIDFVSDTQQPMWVEKILLRPNQNTRATALIFADILKQKPHDLYMLGDVVALGYKNSKWTPVDRFLDSCHVEGIQTHGLLGNHDVMGKPKKGEANFQKRFPEHVRTGYLSVTDSIAIILVNSNFGKLSASDVLVQQHWYETVLDSLAAVQGIKQIIITCHHAPYSNSKIVGSSKLVQEHFLPAFNKSKKANLFITGHAHDFEYFKIKEKTFLVIGGGGGLHQPLDTSGKELPDLDPDYKPMFHYLRIIVYSDHLKVISRNLNNDFTGFTDHFLFDSKIPHS